jgi:hypothetical protein
VLQIAGAPIDREVGKTIWRCDLAIDWRNRSMDAIFFIFQLGRALDSARFCGTTGSLSF